MGWDYTANFGEAGRISLLSFFSHYAFPLPHTLTLAQLTEELKRNTCHDSPKGLHRPIGVSARN
jgi:hypothetical protein